MSPTDRPFVLKILDVAYRERASSAHATLNEAMAAGDEARRKVPTLQRRYVIENSDGDRWVLVGGEVVCAWRKD